MNFKKVISILIVTLIITGVCYEASKPSNNFMMFVDFPSLFIVISIAIVYSLAKGKKYLEYFAEGAVFAGVLGFIIGLISLSYTFSSQNPDIKEIMIANSVLWLTIFYSILIRLFVNIIKT